MESVRGKVCEGKCTRLYDVYCRASKQQLDAKQQLVPKKTLLVLIAVSHPNVIDVLRALSPDVYDSMSELMSLTEPPLVYPTQEVLGTLILLEDPLVKSSLNKLVALGAPNYVMVILAIMMEDLF